MRQAEEYGIPMTRSLMLEFDDTTIHIDDQFMFGSEIMMAPIFKHSSIFTDHDIRDIYFPKADWEHYFTGEKIEGTGQTV